MIDYTTKVVTNRSDRNDFKLITNKLANAGYKMGKNQVMAWLRMQHYLLANGQEWNYPSQEMENKKFLVADEKVYENKVYVKTYVTKLGITWFTAKIIKWFENGHSISEVKGY